ncbi:MAG: hypothetical protein MZW92_40980 [Comamonadaceae bacterium]|nr:hypothetical protein [Comamonadaceae bacterium]
MRIRQIVLAAHDTAAQPRHGGGPAAAGAAVPRPRRGRVRHRQRGLHLRRPVHRGHPRPPRPDSACARHLARHGDSGYMLILQTDDLARERERLARLGVRTVWSTQFDDIGAMHLHPKDVGGAIVSVDEPRPAASWRWGAAAVAAPARPARAAAGARHRLARIRRTGHGATLGRRVRPPRAGVGRWALARGAERRLCRLRTGAGRRRGRGRLHARGGRSRRGARSGPRRGSAGERLQRRTARLAAGDRTGRGRAARIDSHRPEDRRRP